MNKKHTVHCHSTLVSPRGLSPATGNFHRKTGSIASLASPETLRVTMGLSRNESYWQLMHAKNDDHSEIYLPNLTEPSQRNTQKLTSGVSITGKKHPVTALEIPSTRPNPGFKPTSSLPLTNRDRLFPTENDYRRLLNRLDRLIKGSALSFRFTVLTESKPINLSLDTSERQYIRVKTVGLSIPMKVNIQRNMGKIVTYVSKSFNEPDERNSEETHNKDNFVVSEPGLRFKTQFIYLGIHCLEETVLTLSVTFGHKRLNKHKSLTKIPSMTDLEELRKDDGKFEALGRHVETLLAMKQETSRVAFHNFVRENRNKAGKDESGNGKKEVEMQRREDALRRHFQNLKEKKEKAMLLLRRQELRVEAEAKAKAEFEVKMQREEMQKQWLGMLPFFVSVEVIWDTYTKRKACVEEAGRQVKAAMVLQRCYRRVLLQINPKRLIRQHLLHHLSLFTHLFGPEITFQSHTKLLSLFRTSAETSRVKDKLDTFYVKSNLHTVTLIQFMWRRYADIKRNRWELLVTRWTEALQGLIPSTNGMNKKAVKRVKELEAKYMRVDRDSILKEHLKSAQRQYYKDIHKYITANKAFRRGIKGFIYAKLKKGEAVYLSGAPDFHYMLSTAEIQKLILEATNTVESA